MKDTIFFQSTLVDFEKREETRQSALETWTPTHLGGQTLLNSRKSVQIAKVRGQYEAAFPV